MQVVHGHLFGCRWKLTSRASAIENPADIWSSAGAMNRFWMGLIGRRRRGGMGNMLATMIEGKRAQSRGLKLFGPGRKVCMTMLITAVTLTIVVVVTAIVVAADITLVVFIGNIAQFMIANDRNAVQTKYHGWATQG
jgi:hypothetical protein